MNNTQQSPAPTSWEQFHAIGTHKPKLVIGEYYTGMLTSAEDINTHYGGPTGHYARLTFDVAGARLQYTASLPSMWVHFEKCTKLKKALVALNWDGQQSIPSMIGRSCLCRVGENKKGRQVVDELRAEERGN